MLSASDVRREPQRVPACSVGSPSRRLGSQRQQPTPHGRPVNESDCKLSGAAELQCTACVGPEGKGGNRCPTQAQSAEGVSEVDESRAAGPSLLHLLTDPVEPLRAWAQVTPVALSVWVWMPILCSPFPHWCPFSRCLGHQGLQKGLCLLSPYSESPRAPGTLGRVAQCRVPPALGACFVLLSKGWGQQPERKLLGSSSPASQRRSVRTKEGLSTRREA